MAGFHHRAASALLAGVRQRPTSNKIALIGHSMHDQAISQTISGTQIRTAGLELRAWPAWASILSRGRYTFPEDCKFAVSGSLIADIADTALTPLSNPSGFGVGKTQLQAAMACPAQIVAVLSGHNDRFNAVTLATSITRMTGILNALTGAGKTVLLLSEIPSGSAAFAAKRIAGTQLAYHMGWCDWVTRVAPTIWPGMVFAVDPWADFADPAPAAMAGDVISALTQDGVHPSSRGAYLWARRVLSVLDGLGLPPAPPSLHRRGDVYDAINNPRGNLLGANGCLYETGGAMGAAQGGVSFAGTKPVNTNFYPNGSAQGGTLAVTGTMVTTATGAWFQVQISGTTGAGANPNITINPPNVALANLAANDLLHAFGEFEIDANATGLCGFGLVLLRNLPGPAVDNTVLAYGNETGGVLDAVMAGNALAGSWNGDLFQKVSGTETSLQAYLSVIMKSSASIALTFRIRNLAVRKVI